MAISETLTAYKCKISCIKRSSLLTKEEKEKIKLDKLPTYTFTEFISDYNEVSSELAIGKNTDRAILLSKEMSTYSNLEDNVKRWHLTPRAGKQGKPVTVIKPSNKKEYNFNSDSAALYEHHIFVYEKNNDITIIFYRQNGSGCKSVFLETANNVLRPKGLKLSMDLYVPLSNEESFVTPTKIILKYARKVESSDIADNCKSSRAKTQIVRELGLNLEVNDNTNILKIFRNMQLGKVDKSVAFAQIISETESDPIYNDAEVQLRIGKRKKTASWKNFENIVGMYDITTKLQNAIADSQNFKLSLTKIADEYYNSIIVSEENGNAK